MSAEIPRQGRTTAFVRLEFSQDGTHVAQAMAVCTGWREDAPAFADAEPPDVIPLADSRPLDTSDPRVPPLVSNYELRMDTRTDRIPATVSG